MKIGFGLTLAVGFVVGAVGSVDAHFLTRKNAWRSRL